MQRNTCMNIHSHRMMASSSLLTHDVLYISVFAYLYILLVSEFKKLISDFLQNLNPMTLSLKSQDFSFIAWYRLWNYRQFLDNFTWLFNHSFTCFTIILIFFLRSWSHILMICNYDLRKMETLVKLLRLFSIIIFNMIKFLAILFRIKSLAQIKATKIHSYSSLWEFSSNY